MVVLIAAQEAQAVPEVEVQAEMQVAHPQLLAPSIQEVVVAALPA